MFQRVTGRMRRTGNHVWTKVYSSFIQIFFYRPGTFFPCYGNGGHVIYPPTGHFWEWKSKLLITTQRQPCSQDHPHSRPKCGAWSSVCVHVCVCFIFLGRVEGNMHLNRLNNWVLHEKCLYPSCTLSCSPLCRNYTLLFPNKCLFITEGLPFHLPAWNLKCEGLLVMNSSKCTLITR